MADEVRIFSVHSIVANWIEDAIIYSGLRHVPDDIVKSAYGDAMSHFRRGDAKEAKRRIFAHFKAYLRSKRGKRWIYLQGAKWTANVTRKPLPAATRISA